MIELVIKDGKVTEARGLIPGLDLRVKVDSAVYRVVRYGDDIVIDLLEEG